MTRGGKGKKEGAVARYQGGEEEHSVKGDGLKEHRVREGGGQRDGEPHGCRVR